MDVVLPGQGPDRSAGPGVEADLLKELHPAHPFSPSRAALGLEMLGVVPARLLSVEGDRTFVPPGFDVPTRLETPWFVLEPLGPEHNERDFEAWTSSIDHIRATPGFEGRSWPHPMTREENLGDLEMHARHFRDREGFTYTGPPGRPAVRMRRKARWARTGSASARGPHERDPLWLGTHVPGPGHTQLMLVRYFVGLLGFPWVV